MNILLKRLIGFAAAAAALAITGYIHSEALKTFVDDRKSIEEKKEKNRSDSAEE